MTELPKETAGGGGRKSKVSNMASDLVAGLEKLRVEWAALQTYQDAHTVIVSASLLDELLERAPLSKMLPLSETFRKRLFEGYGPLNNFSAKVDMAYALGIVPKEMRNDLRTINSIRICFAHTTKIKNFEDPEIAELLRALPGLDATIPNMKLRWLKRLSQIPQHLDSIIGGDSSSHFEALKPLTEE